MTKMTKNTNLPRSYIQKKIKKCGIRILTPGPPAAGRQGTKYYEYDAQHLFANNYYIYGRVLFVKF
jgi:hypothetical protein